MNIEDILGIVGVTIALGSYILGSIGKMSFNSVSYHIIQLAACAINGAAMYYVGSYPYVFFNLAWAVVGITKLIQLKRVPVAQGPVSYLNFHVRADIDVDDAVDLVRVAFANREVDEVG